MELKQTPLYQKHIEAQARLVDFAGWALPLEYTSVLAEACAVRSTCGLFDASHMGQIRIKGRGALDFLQFLTPNDISLLECGQQQYNLFINRQGGIVDDLIVCRQSQSLLCVVNASNKDKVLNWLTANNDKDVEIVDESDQTALLCLQGPRAQDIMVGLAGERAGTLAYMHFINVELAGRKLMICRSGYTGEDGFELHMGRADAALVWDELVKAGQDLGLNLCGLGARDILRLEAGYPLYGHELDDQTNPYEAGLGWAVKLNEDFIARGALAAAKQAGLERKRIGFIMEERAVARQHYEVYSQDRAIGRVTSGVYSPNLAKFIGMAYVEAQSASIGSPIEIKVRDKLYKAKISKFPFVATHTKR